MAKRKKEDEAPERDWEAEYNQMRAVADEAIRRMRVATYLTVDQFVNEYSAALRDHMRQQFTSSYRTNAEKDNLHHPEDLAATAATFADAHWNISQHIDYTKRGQ